MRYSWFDFAGNVGVAILIVTYLLLQLERLDALKLAYSALNALGAGLIAFSLLFSFNFSAFVVEIFWVAISLFGIYRCLRASRETVK
jgi:hypothetical protein